MIWPAELFLRQARSRDGHNATSSPVYYARSRARHIQAHYSYYAEWTDRGNNFKAAIKNSRRFGT
jgi:hypothetical protein